MCVMVSVSLQKSSFISRQFPYRSDLTADKKMGIASSTESKFASSTESDPRYDLTLLKVLEETEDVKLEDLPEKERVALEAVTDATHEMYWKELRALFPPKLGESSTERDEDDEVAERFSDFMKGGDCKESFTALVDCLETQSTFKCKEHFPILKKCMDAHIRYYEPILALAKATEEKIWKELEAIDTEQQPET